MGKHKSSFVYVEGARELRRSLRAAGDDLADLREVHNAAARIAAEGARRNTPVRSGALRNSIKTSNAATYAEIKAGGRSLPYAPVIHWGGRRGRTLRKGWTRAGGVVRKGWTHGGTVSGPRPFLTLGARETEPRWLALYEKKVARVAKRVKGK